MKAIQISQTGGPEVLKPVELPEPKPGPGEVLIRQTAAAVNFVDVYFRSGLYPVPAMPYIPGVDGVGVVEALGHGVTDFKPGDRVAALVRFGAYAQMRVAPAERLMKIPDGVSDETAGIALLRGLTVWFLVRRAFKVKPGDAILFHAAAGGVGLIAGQWADHLGATVIGTVGSDEKIAIAQANGYEHVINYSTGDFEARVMEITHGRGVDVVYDGVGKATFPKSLRCIKKFGLWVTFGNASGPVPPIDLLKDQKGSIFITRPTLFDYVEDTAELRAGAAEYFDLLKRGVIKLDEPLRFPLDQAAGAHRALQNRDRTGFIVLKP